MSLDSLLYVPCYRARKCEEIQEESLTWSTIKRDAFFKLWKFTEKLFFFQLKKYSHAIWSSIFHVSFFLSPFQYSWEHRAIRCCSRVLEEARYLGLCLDWIDAPDKCRPIFLDVSIVLRGSFKKIFEEYGNVLIIYRKKLNDLKTEWFEGGILKLQFQTTFLILQRILKTCIEISTYFVNQKILRKPVLKYESRSLCLCSWWASPYLFLNWKLLSEQSILISKKHVHWPKQNKDESS